MNLSGEQACAVGYCIVRREEGERESSLELATPTTGSLDRTQWKRIVFERQAWIAYRDLTCIYFRHAKFFREMRRISVIWDMDLRFENIRLQKPGKEIMTVEGWKEGETVALREAARPARPGTERWISNKTQPQCPGASSIKGKAF